MVTVGRKILASGELLSPGIQVTDWIVPILRPLQLGIHLKHAILRL